MGIRVAVAGATGYAGGELLRLLAGHSGLDVCAVTGHSNAGAPLSAVHPHLVSLDLTVRPTEPSAVAGADLVFLALPHGESAAFAVALPPAVKVVDLAADHRGTWPYGLPELPGQRAAIAAASRVANTGCYAVATILALAPLLAAGVADPDDVVVVAASGTSGAGRTPKAHLLGSEVMGDLSPYKVGEHQHVPEIKRATGARTLSFTPVLAPMPRGILATVTARRVGAESPADVLARAYADEPFVHVLPEGSWPHTAATLGANTCHLQSTVDADSGRIIVTSAIDNLGKGAAGQAIQCANLMLGLPETLGLPVNGVAP
ncbi:MAG TPA: N-acetyl-gamma-glutamyl-phosphate reductase [Micromonosporaceae bacterium]|nr:N-acetyl-gamma-glutamyl-phosphate reductase [Micromonosporaceae bacterium]